VGCGRTRAGLVLTTGELRVPGERMGIMAIAGTAKAGQ